MHTYIHTYLSLSLYIYIYIIHTYLYIYIYIFFLSQAMLVGTMLVGLLGVIRHFRACLAHVQVTNQGLWSAFQGGRLLAVCKQSWRQQIHHGIARRAQQIGYAAEHIYVGRTFVTCLCTVLVGCRDGRIQKYIYIYVHIYLSLYICIYIYIHIYIYIYTHTHGACQDISSTPRIKATCRPLRRRRSCTFTEEVLYVCIHIYIYIYICMGVYIYIYIYIYIHIHIHTYVYIYIYIYIYVYM